MDRLTVNQLVERLHNAVDPEDRDHVYVRLILHGREKPTATGRAEYVNGGTGYDFVNIVGDQRD